MFDKSNAETNETSQYGVDKKHAAIAGIIMTATGSQKFFLRYENVFLRYFTPLLYSFKRAFATVFYEANVFLRVLFPVLLS